VSAKKSTNRGRKKPAFSWAVDRPLDDLGGETSASNRALRDYALMGPKRSLLKLLASYQAVPKPAPKGQAPPTRREATLKTWSVKYQWQERIRRFDLLEAEAEVEKWRKRRAEVRESDWQLGEEFRRSLKAFLQQLPRFITSTETMTSEPGPDGAERDVLVRVVGLNTDIRQLATAFKAISELQRLAADLPTDITQELSGAALETELGFAIGEYLKVLLESDLPDDELVQMLRSYVTLGELDDTD